MKQEKSQINNLTYHLKKLEKEQTNARVSRRIVTVKIREEINKIETKTKNKNKHTHTHTTHNRNDQ